jgi:hypothetical protein
MPKLSNTQVGFELLSELYSTLEKNKLLHLAHNTAVKRISSIGLLLLPLIGTPTHHSKMVAFQTPASSIMEGIVDLHHDIMFFLVFIMVFVLYLLAVVVIQFSEDSNHNIHGYAGDNVTHSTPLEII